MYVRPLLSVPCFLASINMMASSLKCRLRSPRRIQYSAPGNVQVVYFETPSCIQAQNLEFNYLCNKHRSSLDLDSQKDDLVRALREAEQPLTSVVPCCCAAL